ncbi:mesoderm posterior ba [Brachyhypopomus gauderio]|uniref:mesoderm posterior ba n=1 Tax=Brachyhypopomus gauderio TaxID=698409 RepID=UPI004042E181
MDTYSFSLPAQRQWSCPSSDSELYSVSSPETVSPAPSVDLSCSPSFRPGCASSKAERVGSEKAQAPASPSSAGPGRRSRRTRLRNPSEQRQSASEKEKLRMRDLTKALHHLRTYLPPSVAPVGQTLTKIETLRLTIRYISHLSAQLGLSEEYLSRRRRDDGWRAPQDILGYFQCSSAARAWDQGQGQGGVAEPHIIGNDVHCAGQQPDACQYRSARPEALTDTAYTTDFSSLQPPQSSQITQPCQNFSELLIIRTSSELLI